jgi:hypothetical protein
MVDQIITDQQGLGETVGEAAPGADDASAVRSSEEIISEIVRHHNGRLVRFAGGPFGGKMMVWTGGEIIQVDEAPPPLKITDKQSDQPPPFRAHVAGHIYRQSADHDIFIYEGPRT